jgi:hypothetical protein
VTTGQASIDGLKHVTDRVPKLEVTHNIEKPQPCTNLLEMNEKSDNFIIIPSGDRPRLDPSFFPPPSTRVPKANLLSKTKEILISKIDASVDAVAHL